MRSLNEITKQLKEVGDFIASNYGMEGVELTERIRSLNGYHALMPELIADAEYHLSEKIAETTDKIDFTDKSNNATRINLIINKNTLTEKRLVRLAERVNATLTHQLDAIRSQLSYLKSLND